MARNPGGKNLISAVRETLDTVVTPSVREAILSRALDEAHRKDLPTDPEELNRFVQGPLQDALVRSLGPELGVTVSAELDRIVTIASRDAVARSQRVATSGSGRSKQVTAPPRANLAPTQAPKRRTSRSTLPSRGATPKPSLAAQDRKWVEQQQRGFAPTLPAGKPRATSARVPADEAERRRMPTLPASPTSADYPAGTAKALGVIGTISLDPPAARRPVVLVASSDPELVRAFGAWLDRRASVEAVSGASALLHRLAATSGERCIVVLDGKHPAVRPLTLAALADELPETTSVMLWGVAPHLHARMRTIASVTEKWLIAGVDATTEEVVGRCAKLVG